MAWCKGCGQDKSRAHGCRRAGVAIDGITYIRIRLGRETARRGRAAVCAGCNVERGELHHVGCGVEQCPACLGKLAKCGCAAGKELSKLA